MNAQIKVSVVVPVYNLQNELKKCVSSIEKQTHSNIEIILVNDGSTDKSWDVICHLAEKDNRIIPINKENGGVTSARLAGVQKASGEYIGFVDGDDEIEKDMYEILRFNLSRCFSAYSQQRYNNLGRGCSCRFFCCKQFIKNHPVILQFPDIQI
ncbi:MAG: glycosyltransferase [Lachnoclostridium sp.]|nr:glycosyltransferase [Lachnoclostridium sp.]